MVDRTIESHYEEFLLLPCAGQLFAGGVRSATMASLGRLAQSVRALPLQGRSHRFESCSAHLNVCTGIGYRGLLVIVPDLANRNGC